jgi:superfamily II DNA or RNA helicase
VFIKINNGLMFVTPVDERDYKFFSFLRSVRTPAGRVAQEREDLYHPTVVNGIPALYAPVGLFEDYKELLSRRGITPTIEDARPPRTSADFSKTEGVEFRDGQKEVLHLIDKHSMGIIAAATGYGKSFLIKQICRIYPNDNIVIVTAAKSVVMGIYEDLMKDPELAYQTGALCSAKNTGPNFRIVVTTIRSLHKTNNEKCSILLADECHNFGAASTSERIAKFMHSRKYAFSASPFGRTDNAHKLITAMFGPVLFNFEYVQAVDAGAVVPIEVHAYRCRQGLSTNYKNDLAVKRHGYWQNKWRNTLIRDIAAMHKDKQVLIMCDKIEHVMSLKKLMPHAEIAYANLSKDDYETKYVAGGYTTDRYMTPKDLEAQKARLESGEIRLCICTMIYKEGVNFHQLGCLIRADGSTSEIASTQIPGRLSRQFEGKDKGILVDFIDSFDERLYRRSQRRMKSYDKKGWVIMHD